jgi:ubiquinone/menaquinone biosynthesis C-methylase UbiE
MNNSKYVTHNREPFFQIAKNLINPTSTVLDVGAGNGKFADYCNLNSIYLMDGNRESINNLKRKYTNVYYGKLPKLPFEDHKFDLIHLSHVIEHLQPQEVYDTLIEFDRCCKPGGAIVISAPLMWEGFYDDLSHIKPYNPSIFQRYLCSIKQDNYSREIISSDYKVEILQYRFLEKNYFYGIKHSSRILPRIILKIYNYLKMMGLRQYEKTGYTIVLRKEII